MRWYVMGESCQVSPVEARKAEGLCSVLDRGLAEIATSATLSVAGETDTTVMVVERPGERLLFIKRLDGSIVVATDRYEWAGGDDW